MNCITFDGRSFGLWAGSKSNSIYWDGSIKHTLPGFPIGLQGVLWRKDGEKYAAIVVVTSCSVKISVRSRPEYSLVDFFDCVNYSDNFYEICCFSANDLVPSHSKLFLGLKSESLSGQIISSSIYAGSPIVSGVEEPDFKVDYEMESEAPVALWQDGTHGKWNAAFSSSERVSKETGSSKILRQPEDLHLNLLSILSSNAKGGIFKDRLVFWHSSRIISHLKLSKIKDVSYPVIELGNGSIRDIAIAPEKGIAAVLDRDYQISFYSLDFGVRLKVKDFETPKSSSIASFGFNRAESQFRCFLVEDTLSKEPALKRWALDFID